MIFQLKFVMIFLTDMDNNFYMIDTSKIWFQSTGGHKLGELHVF